MSQPKSPLPLVTSTYALFVLHRYMHLLEQASEQHMERVKLNKKRNAIVKFVREHHRNKNGTPTAITPPKEEGGFWYTCDPRDSYKKIRAKDEETLYMKLFDIYSERFVFENFSVKAWYSIGIDYRKRKSNPLQSTFERHDRTVKTYFTDELLCSDVREVTSHYIWGFMRDCQEKHNMSLSEAKQLKGTLNLIFEAASDPEIGCRAYNPMLTINPSGLYKNNAKAINREATKKKRLAFSELQTHTLQTEFRNRVDINRSIRYDRCQYALMGLMASYTGMRSSELPALRWDDVHEHYIHLHQMQIRHDGKHGEERFEIVPWLKEEKGAPRGGRMIPFFNDAIPALLNEIKEVQSFFKIESEWIFPNTDCLSYERSIYQLCKKLGYEITNNHAFRKGFNMRMMDMGLNVADRSAILGHSAEVNLRNYTVTSDNWIEEVLKKAQVTERF